MLLSALPDPNDGSQWWGAHPGPEGSQALLQDVHQSFAAHHLNNIVWIWEAKGGASARDPARRSAAMDDFYPGPLSADLILLDQLNPGRDQGWGVRIARQLSVPKPLGIRTSSANPIATETFDFVVVTAGAAPIANASPTQ